MSDETLRDSAKVAINTYIFKWLAALGIINSGAIFLGLGYIFFVMPQEAAARAEAMIGVEIESKISVLQQRAFDSTAGALQESDRVSERARIIDGEANRLESRVIKLREDIAELDQSDVINIREVAALLQDNDELGAVFEQAQKLNALDVRLGDLTRRISGLGSGSNCRWEPISNSTGGHAGATEGKEWTGRCPAGYFARGYRLSTWNAQSTYHHALECCGL